MQHQEAGAGLTGHGVVNRTHSRGCLAWALAEEEWMAPASQAEEEH